MCVHMALREGSQMRRLPRYFAGCLSGSRIESSTGTHGL